MKRLLTTAAAGLIALTSLAGVAIADPHGNGHGHDQGGQEQRGQDARGQDDHGQDQRGQDQRGYDENGRGQRGHSGFDANHHDNGRHEGWRKGGRIAREDWSRGQRIDWRRHHLRQPPRGYEWRQVDNSYVLATPASGLIASIIGGLR